ncbi:MAG: DegV family EDD domain-containing protein, partial [Candidatus Nealsonbacteria bacterium]|nr:DegV family EDD domain-containing protein [Candidatus Nealsonbacteria bacterium]
KTLLGIKEFVEGKDFKKINEISESALDGALTNAQGNAGVIYTGFLAGFLSDLVGDSIDVPKLAIALEKGSQRARQSIQNPKEGTILDVIDATAETFKRESGKEKDVIIVFRKSVENAREALLATREKMEIFRRANVVDAGGLGFLIILESYLEAIDPEFVEVLQKHEKPSEKVKRFIQTISYRYEVVCLLKNSTIDERRIREKLKKLGNCLDIVQVKDKIKIHIHTDYPEEVKSILINAGQAQSMRVEDMAKEVAGEESVRKVAIGIVTEDAVDLPKKVLERYQIETAPLVFDWPEGENLPGENICQKMREADKRGIKDFPKVSPAIPKAYSNALEKQIDKFGKVLCITLSSNISGCYDSAKQAEKTITKSGRIIILDSLNASAGQSLLALRAIELIQEQREVNEVLAEIKKLIPKTFFYLDLEDPKWMESAKKITKGQANWIKRMKKLKLQPLLTIKKGKIVKEGTVYAKSAAEALFKKISKETKNARKNGLRIRAVISHADNLEGAESLRKMLKEIKAEVPFVVLSSPANCVNVGPGALIVAWQAL